MKKINFWGGFFFVVGLLIFLSSCIEMAAFNVYSDFGWSAGNYENTISGYKVTMYIGGAISAIGAGGAWMRESLNIEKKDKGEGTRKRIRQF